MKIGVFGGSFNPPHWGHLLVIQQILDAQIVDEIWLMPCCLHSEKPTSLAPARHRLAMLKLLARGLKHVKISDFELRQNKVSYTQETLLALKKKFSQHEFYWIIGSDLIKQIPRWKNAELLPKLTEFIVYPRLGDSVKPKKGFRVLPARIETNASSTLIRRHVRDGKEITHLTTQAIAEYINKQGLYI